MNCSRFKKLLVLVVMAGLFAGCGTQGEEDYNWTGFMDDNECEKKTVSYSYCKLSSFDLEISIGDLELEVTRLDYPAQVENIEYIEGGIYDNHYGRSFKLSIGDVCDRLREDPNYEGNVESEFWYDEETEIESHNDYYAVDTDAVGYLDGEGKYSLELFLGEYEDDGAYDEEVEEGGEDLYGESDNEGGWINNYDIDDRHIVLNVQVTLDEGEYETCR